MITIVKASEFPYWEKRHLRAMKLAKNFEVAADICLDVLDGMPDDISELCGPISTGGLGSEEKNLKLFDGCLMKLIEEGLNPFYQTPLQLAVPRLIAKWKKEGGEGYCMPILEVAYRRIFESGFIKSARFLPGWQSSFGTSWEMTTLTGLKIPTYDFPLSWYHQVLKNLIVE